MEGFFISLVIGAIIGLLFRAAKNSGKANTPKEYMYSCPQSQLIEAIKKAANSVDYEVNKVDPIGGRIRLEIPYSFTSNGEWMDIQLMEVAPDKTKAVINCVSKRGPENFSKNRKNIERLLDAVSQIFSEAV